MADFSVSIYDAETNLIGQYAGCPIHLGAMSFSTKACVAKFPKLDEGDVVIINDPYAGGTHTPDVTCVAPMYYKGEIMGYACARAHWVDMGGGGVGSQAWGTHIATEGFRIFPMKLVEKGKINKEFVELVKNQVRAPQGVEGDFMAQIGACGVAQMEMVKLIERFDVETVKIAMKEIREYTKYVFRSIIEKLPDGEYEGVDFAETDGVREKSVAIKTKITIKGDQLTVDFKGTDPLVEGAINSPLANTHGAVLYSSIGMLAPGLPINEGIYDCIDIKVPEGCWLNARWPHPTIGSTTHTATKIATSVWMALSKIDPKKAIGSTYGECNWYIASVKDPETGLPMLVSDLPSGGWGATSEHDGMNAANDPHIVNALLMSAEVAEMAHPVYWQHYGMRTDSGGPGKYRGGVGMIFKFKPLGDMELSMETSRTKIGAPGVEGGGRGSIQYVLKQYPDGKLETVMGNDLEKEGKWHMSLQANMRFEEGTSFVLLTSGGGGYGDPLERDPEKVLQDVIDQYVSIEGARKDYGVVIDPKTMAIDYEETMTLRKQLSMSEEFKQYIQGVRKDYLLLQSIL
nr:hydantoinase B/oxoprolinase family protein [Desulfoscipio gibsoniae]